MTNPHNVDICVTCVSEKPPQLPLREELPSLGIEVVYNAQGVGAKASRNEQKKKLKQFQKETEKKKKSPKGLRAFFGRNKQEREDQEARRKEEELRVPHALSYNSYHKVLHEANRKLSSKAEGQASWDTESTAEASKHTDNNSGQYNDQPHLQSPSMSKMSGMTTISGMQPPIRSLEIPSQSPEELAIQEAFNVFASDPPGFLMPPTTKREGSVSQGNSTLLDPSTISSHTVSKRPNVKIEAGTPSVKLDLPALTEPIGSNAETSSGSSSKGKSSIESFAQMAQDYLASHIPGLPSPSQNDESLSSRPSSSSRPSEASRPSLASRPSDERGLTSEDSTLGSNKIRVAEFSQNNKVSEFYDLTAISDEESKSKKGISSEEETSSSGRDLSTLSSRHQRAFIPKIQLYPTPAVRKELPGLAVAIPEEDDGYGNIVFDLSDVREEDGPGSPLVYCSPAQKRTNPKHEQSFGTFDSFYADAERKLSLLKPKLDYSRSTIGGPSIRNAYSEVIDENSTQDGHQLASVSYDQFFLPRAMPKGSDLSFDNSVPTPSLKKSASRESEVRSKLSVSFSHDVESRFYNNEEQVSSYDRLLESTSEDLDEQFVSVWNRARSKHEADRPGYSKFAAMATTPAITQLVDALLNGGPLPERVDHIVTQNPLIAGAKLPESDLYPLHAACMREFPNRFEDGEPCLVKDLVDDIVERKTLIFALVRVDPESSRRLDENGDLPVHIIARQLMEWEAKWYQKVYETAREETDEKSGRGSGITMLYQTMSQIVNGLLGPLTLDVELCQQSGSVGYLLPLHIAAIFTVTYDTLKDLIERYPEAAGQKCNLDEVRTFIPNYSIPLELHHRLSTDFPKWEIEAASEKPEAEILWTQSTLDRSYGTTGGMRRSDLMFAFYPEAEPYRNEISRIRRLEARIRTEVGTIENEEEFEMSQAATLLWFWFCTYQGVDAKDNYADSVKRIVQPLSMKAVKFLSLMTNNAGKHLADVAPVKTIAAFKDRLNEIADTYIPIPFAPLSSEYGSRKRGVILRDWDQQMASRFCLQGRGFVGMLSRTLFNITETSFPTNFVILPYKLVKDSEGRLGLESADAANVAMRFAESLLHLTDPDKILHFLEKKAIRFHDNSLGVESSSDWDSVEVQTRQQVAKLLELYATGPAYFYFLDEYSGVPLVLENGSASYPLVLSDASETVRKVLPLMISGMILMRGEKALTVLAKVLLSKNVKTVHRNWIEAAKDLIGYLYSPQTAWTTTFLQDLRPLRAQLVEFVEGGHSKNAPEAGQNDLSSEWVVELSLVKMILEMHDSSYTLCGLGARRAGHQVLWTSDAAFLDLDSKEQLFRMDFQTLSALKEQSQFMEEDRLEGRRKQQKQLIAALEEDDDEYEAEDTSPDSAGSGSEAYEPLFRELQFQYASENDESRNELEKSESQDLQSREIISLVDEYIAEPPMIERRRMKSASEPISLLNFDDDLDLDDVLQLRILLDEQEAKLEFLRDKVSDIQVAELELLEQEDQLGDMLDTINNDERNAALMKSSKGLSDARQLLLRICELEDRVLCREVEVGQLKNDITCFEMEASVASS